MENKDIKKLVLDPNYIPGIYNYCDRWCERCKFTSRCANFALGEKHFSDPGSLDIKNAQFWKKLGDALKMTLDLIKEMAEKEGIDLDSIDIDSSLDDKKKIREQAKNHVAVLAAQKYSCMVEIWFESAKDLFDEKREELDLKIRLELPEADPFGEAATLKDAVEVIQWYQHQIYVKMMRAVEGKLGGTPEILKGFPKDSDGSAKVALIDMDRSIAAWGTILQHFPDCEDDLLKILVHLIQLRRKSEAAFPNARAFVRPGFDEE